MNCTFWYFCPSLDFASTHIMESLDIPNRCLYLDFLPCICHTAVVGKKARYLWSWVLNMWIPSWGEEIEENVSVLWKNSRERGGGELEWGQS